MASPKRWFDAWFAGRSAEVRAARWLRAQGLAVIQRNVRIGGGEIDLVAIDCGVVVFVEVRLRSEGFGAALASVDREKRRRFTRAVAAYRARERLRTASCRGDLLLVSRKGGEWMIGHLPGEIPVDGIVDPHRR